MARVPKAPQPTMGTRQTPASQHLVCGYYHVPPSAVAYAQAQQRLRTGPKTRQAPAVQIGSAWVPYLDYKTLVLLVGDGRAAARSALPYDTPEQRIMRVVWDRVARRTFRARHRL